MMNVDLFRESLRYYNSRYIIIQGHIRKLGGVSKKINKLFKEVMEELHPEMILTIIIYNNDKNSFERKLNLIERNDIKKLSAVLDSAISKKNMDIIKIIFNYANDVKKMFDTYDLMRLVFHYGNPEYIKYIESWGVNYKNNIDIYLVSACNTGNMEMIKFAHQNGADIVNNTTAVRNVILLRNLEVVKYLCENGANINNYDILNCVLITEDIDIINYIYTLDKNIINETALKILVKKSFIDIIIHLNENNMINQEHKNIILEEARKLKKSNIINYLSKIEN